MTRHTPMTEYRTITPTAVMPPHADAIPRMPPMSMAEDARICNARMRSVTGMGNTTSSEAKQRLANIVQERRKEHRARVLALLQQGPATVREIINACHLADHTARECLLWLNSEGLAAKQAGHMRGGKAVWGVAIA